MNNPVVAEFLGTGVLLGSISFLQSPAFIIAAFAVAVLFAGPISGAHINPAVTLWTFLSGKISGQKAMMYVFAQLAAAVAIYLVKSF